MNDDHVNPYAGTNSQPATVIGPLLRSLWAVRCLFVAMVLFTIASGAVYLYQSTYRNEFGDPLWKEPGMWPHLIGHLLRTFVGLGLAWALWGYLCDISRWKRGEDNLEDVFRSLARFWRVMFAGALTLFAYGVWIAFGQVPRAASDNEALSPRFHRDPSSESALPIEFRLAEHEPADGLVEARIGDTSDTVFLHPRPLVTNRDIVEARAVLKGDVPAIEVEFASEVHAKLRAATHAHVGRPLAVLIDGRVVAAPIVQFQFGSGAIITLQMSHAEAAQLARDLVRVD
jgi:hypothetical protein